MVTLVITLLLTFIRSCFCKSSCNQNLPFILSPVPTAVKVLSVNIFRYWLWINNFSHTLQIQTNLSCCLANSYSSFHELKRITCWRHHIVDTMHVAIFTHTHLKWLSQEFVRKFPYLSLRRHSLIYCCSLDPNTLCQYTNPINHLCWSDVLHYGAGIAIPRFPLVTEWLQGARLFLAQEHMLRSKTTY